jgi:hypothetical protein
VSIRRTTGKGVATKGAINKFLSPNHFGVAVFVSVDAYFFFEYQNGKFWKTIKIAKESLLGNVLRLLYGFWSSGFTAFHAALGAEFKVFLLAL